LFGCSFDTDSNEKTSFFKKHTNKSMTSKNQFHNFHIVNLSPWPFATAFSIFTMLLGLVQFMHNYKFGLFFFFFGFFITLFIAISWFRDIVREATFEGKHSVLVQQGLRFGMILFIVSEIMLFFAFFWAYFHSCLNAVPELGAVWPPQSILTVNPWLIPLLNTVLLLISGSTLTWSHAALVDGSRLETITGLILTIVYAIFFTSFQLFEYIKAPFHISDGVYGSTFYMLTGLHGFHVFVGTILLSVTLWRVLRNHFTTERHIGYESAAWYWHFVDVVWIFLFLVIYVYAGQNFQAN